MAIHFLDFDGAFRRAPGKDLILSPEWRFSNPPYIEFQHYCLQSDNSALYLHGVAIAFDNGKVNMENALPKELQGSLYNEPGEEGPVAKSIEKQTAKISSDVFLWAALGSMAGALTLKIAGRKHDALFVGQWAAPFLLLGLYNKVVKVAGHDRKHPNAGTDGEKGGEPSLD